jgi:dGTPase
LQVSERCDRRHPLPAPDPDQPFPFVWDRDRILQSPEFQRLRHVTQVMAVAEPGQYHNRLSHSLAVEHIGRGLAEALLTRSHDEALAATAGGLDPAVVEAACLAHDLGHPPFAHVAESELDRLLTAAGVANGFEANAQAFRVVCTLATNGVGDSGLNLTRATLGAILKYPWLRHDAAVIPHKWGAYQAEANDLAWAWALAPPGSQEPTLEAAVMDWADLVAYAVLDFEDFARVELIPLKELATSAQEREHILELVCERRRIPKAEQGEFEALFERLLTECPTTRMSPNSRQSRNALRCFSQHQIDEAIGAVTLSANGDSAPALAIDPTTQAKILLLEGLTWHYVIDSALLVPQRDEQRTIICSLFEALAEAVCSEAEDHRFPKPYKEQLRRSESEPGRLRIVSDYLASMTEAQAIAIHRELVEASV